MSYKIGSFNVRKLSGNNKERCIKVAEVIEESLFDIVALQEILDEYAVETIVKKLGPKKWEGYWDAPDKYSKQANEGYAFIWKKDKLKIVEETTSSGQKYKANPRIYNHYRASEFGRELIRNPLYGRFTADGCREGANFFEIRLINTHIVFGDNSIMNVEERKKEFGILATNILPKIKDRRYGTNYSAYTLVLGDYNLNIKKGSSSSNIGPWGVPQIFEVIYLNDKGTITDIRKQSNVIRTSQQELTSLTRGMEGTEYSYRNNYDHFTFDEKIASKCDIRTCKRVEAESLECCGRKIERFVKEISDNVPILIELDLIKRR